MTGHQLPKSKGSCCGNTTALVSNGDTAGIAFQTYYVDVGSSGHAFSVGRGLFLKSIVSFPLEADLQMMSRDRQAAAYARNIIIAWHHSQSQAATDVGEMAANYRLMQRQHRKKISDIYKFPVNLALNEDLERELLPLYATEGIRGAL